ncbi:hypothetical protein GCM10010145_24870 [Streptomyces ruber]|uniref:Uncharacterized protein n=2 Tax=Streptomyces TaxID=1883 RepID=A0A918BD52_9ACTN|nr:hypothetical protein [Streptomyces ruber]GGQ54379.1 hypothetical protein GCM10010145_24870 [Streptomyces ruber]
MTLRTRMAAQALLPLLAVMLSAVTACGPQEDDRSPGTSQEHRLPEEPQPVISSGEAYIPAD